MALKTCPRCRETGFERMESYGVCHNCNFNTEEGYSWQPNSDRTPMRHPSVTAEEMNEGLKRLKASDRMAQLFTESDYRLARRVIAELPQPEKEVVLLKFWGRQDAIGIAERLGLRLSTVESTLAKACDRIRNACLKHPTFSRSHASSNHAAA
jgi:DNA-directed RNA polymerase specialized sigma24 family protein